MVMNNSTYNQLNCNLDILKLSQMQIHLAEVTDFVTSNNLSSLPQGKSAQLLYSMQEMDDGGMPL